MAERSPDTDTVEQRLSAIGTSEMRLAEHGRDSSPVVQRYPRQILRLVRSGSDGAFGNCTWRYTIRASRPQKSSRSPMLVTRRAFWLALETGVLPRPQGPAEQDSGWRAGGCARRALLGATAITYWGPCGTLRQPLWTRVGGQASTDLPPERRASQVRSARCAPTAGTTCGLGYVVPWPCRHSRTG